MWVICCVQSDRKEEIHSKATPVNPLKHSGIRRLHFKVFSAIQVYPTLLISDIRALWRSGLSARVPEYQKLKCKLDLDGPENFKISCSQ